jgi:multicomponent Na+:H+ antiporter subunit A
MSPERWIVFAAVALPFATAALVPLGYRAVGDRVGYAGAAVAAACFGLVASLLGTNATVSTPWIPSMDVAVRFHVDGWALLFALLASGIGVVIFAYSAVYMHGKPNLVRFYAALSAFMGSILGVAFAADLLVFFLFWELTSVCSFVLIGYHTDDPESQASARMAMLVTVGGGLCLLVGILLLSVAAGAVLDGSSFDLAAILANEEGVGAELKERGLFLPALAFVTVAAGAKSAQVPLHFWLPRAMVAPTPVSAFLHSATMVKVGVYVLGRLRPLFGGPAWELLIAPLGLATMTVGAVLAVRATDIKELLAYSTASHLGLMVAAFGFQVHYGAEAGAFHLLNHALFKAALFLVAGILAHEVGTRRVDELGGLWRDLPVTAAITGVTALSMAGIPPLHGFYSKELLFAAAWDTAQAGGGLAWLYPATAVFASAFTVLYSLRFLWLFLGERPDAIGSVHRPSPALVAPPALLAGAALAVTALPERAIDLVVQDGALATATAGEKVSVHAELPVELSGPVVMSLLAVGSGVAAFPAYGRLLDTVNRGYWVAGPLHPTAAYHRLLAGIERASGVVGARLHTGLIRTYAWWALAGACTITLAGFATTGASPAIVGLDAPAAMVLVLGVAVVAAVAVSVTDTHVTGVLTLGILGFMVAIFYILASGPDLALTQLVVETLLLLIFLLVIEELPAFYGDLDLAVAARDAVLSFVVGATAFVSVLLVAPSGGGSLSDTADFYVEHAVEGGGGTNVVNVILTDFRAFDTLGESIVIVMAALSVLVLLAMRGRGETR